MYFWTVCKTVLIHTRFTSLRSLIILINICNNHEGYQHHNQRRCSVQRQQEIWKCQSNSDSLIFFCGWFWTKGWDLDILKIWSHFKFRQTWSWTYMLTPSSSGFIHLLIRQHPHYKSCKSIVFRGVCMAARNDKGEHFQIHTGKQNRSLPCLTEIQVLIGLY